MNESLEVTLELRPKKLVLGFDTTRIPPLHGLTGPAAEVNDGIVYMPGGSVTFLSFFFGTLHKIGARREDSRGRREVWSVKGGQERCPQCRYCDAHRILRFLGGRGRNRAVGSGTKPRQSEMAETAGEHNRPDSLCLSYAGDGAQLVRRASHDQN